MARGATQEQEQVQEQANGEATVAADDLASRLIVRAEQLIAAKRAVLADLQEVRVMLNMFKNQGMLNAEQNKFVTEQLPRKSRKSKDGSTEDDES
jgi:hypothetical protein